jgi:4-amino-4-deoxy-L-arabinose transferase-like glycosyltransferase
MDRQLFCLFAAVCLCLAPFLSKPFNIDDTLFLRAAEQIQKQPANFYGNTINWYGTSMPMHRVFENPPLTSYYIAAVTRIVGWSETALHLAFLLPALAAAWGIFSLARRLSLQPTIATILSILTPVFLISASTVMCDVMLLAFWIWAVVEFERGLEKNSTSAFLLSGALAGLAVLTKFPGLGLVPLLGVYGAVRQRRSGKWIFAILIPIGFAAGYEWITHSLYGEGLFFGAARFAVGARTAPEGNFLERIVLGLEFVGGCFLPTLLVVFWAWPKRGLLALLCVAGFCILVLPTLAPMAKALWHGNESLKWGRLLHGVVFTVGGLNLLLILALDCWTRRDATSLLLLLWICGIFFFAIVVNWTLNGRSLLPMAPAVGLLVARRLDSFARGKKLSPIWIGVAAAAISLIPLAGDHALARADWTAAKDLCSKYRKPGRTLWFVGHWGFQYYMEARGAVALDRKSSAPAEHDIIVVPSNASNVWKPSADSARTIETAAYGTNRFCTTMSLTDGAGFYGAIWGPLPFIVGEIDPNRFEVFEVTTGATSQKTAIVLQTAPATR